MKRIVRILLLVSVLALLFRYRIVVQEPVEALLAGFGSADSVADPSSSANSSLLRGACEIRDRFVLAQRSLVRVPDYVRQSDHYEVGQVEGASIKDKTLQVGLGALQGVTVGAPVLFGDVWVGEVESVGSHSSKVKVVSHPRFRTGAFLSRKDREGRPIRLCLQGTTEAAHFLEVLFVSVYEEILPGAQVRALLQDRPTWSPRLGRISGSGGPGNHRGMLRLEPLVDLSSLFYVSIQCKKAQSTGALALGFVRFSTILAKIKQGRDPAPFRESLLLNRGSRDGVHPGAAVLVQGVLVGCVSRVSETTCRVLRLGDPELELMGTLTSTDGEVTAESFAGIRFRFLPKGLLTSGFIEVLGREGTPAVEEVSLLLTAAGAGSIPAGVPVALVPPTEGGGDRLPVRLLVDLRKVDAVEILLDPSWVERS